MHKFFRKNKKVVVWFVVIAFTFGGALMGYGAWNMFKSGGDTPQVAAAKGLATVNNEPVTVEEFYQVYQNYANYLTDAPAEMFLVYQYQSLKEIIESKVLIQEANKQKVEVTVSEADVDDYIVQVQASNNISPEALTEMLEQAGISMEEWRGHVKTALHEPKRIEKLYEKAVGEVIVTEADIINEYEEVRARTIFVKTEDKAKIEEALAKINAGEEFADVAKAYSQALSASNGGDLGFFDRQYYGMEEEVIEIAFGMEVGQLSSIIETEGGYHLLKVIDKKIAEGEAFEEQKEEIKTRLITLKGSQRKAEWFADLMAKAKIEIHIPEFAGYKALSENNFNLAISEFKRAINNSPGNGALYSYLAQAYKGSGQDDKAVQTYEQAIAEATVSWKTYYDLGWTYKEMGENEKAIDNLKKASETAGDDKWAHERIMAIYEAMGYQELALVEKAILEKIDLKAAEEAQRWLEEVEAQSALEAGEGEGSEE